MEVLNTDNTIRNVSKGKNERQKKKKNILWTRDVKFQNGSYFPSRPNLSDTINIKYLGPYLGFLPFPVFGSDMR